VRKDQKGSTSDSDVLWSGSGGLPSGPVVEEGNRGRVWGAQPDALAGVVSFAAGIRPRIGPSTSVATAIDDRNLPAEVTPPPVRAGPG